MYPHFIVTVAPLHMDDDDDIICLINIHIIIIFTYYITSVHIHYKKNLYASIKLQFV